jgi:glyoxylase-like metal-dependent hydrolase (beta-lactamase superfamily II)
MPNQKRKSNLRESSSLKVERLIVGQMSANCYLLYDSVSNEAVIIDPGDDAEYIQNKIADLGLTPKAIIATHGHFDHVLASEELKLIYQIPFLINKKDEFILNYASKSYKHFLKQKTELEVGKSNGYLQDNEKIILGRSKIKVIETPGHTPGGICLYCKKDGFLFTGDTLFSGGLVGRTDFKYSNESNLKKSIKKILSLGKNIRCFPGHGDSFSN